MAINISNVVYALEISEVELNPEGSDAGNEWIEIYSEEEVDLERFYLKNEDGDVYNLSGSFSNYLVVNFLKQWLDNSDEKVYLYDSGNTLVDKTVLLEDGDNDGMTWNYCGGVWKFFEGSKGRVNLCATPEVDEELSVEQMNSEDEENDDIEENVIENAEGIIGSSVLLNESGAVKSKIVLNAPKTFENEQVEDTKKIFVSKQEKLRKGVVYAFLVFVVVLVILLSLRRL